jgi:hypothetical protein
MNYTPIANVPVGRVSRVQVADVPNFELDTPATDSPFTPTANQINSASVSAGLLAACGFGNFVAQGNYTYYLMDLLSTQTQVSTKPTDAVDYWVKGVGLRLVARGLSVSAQAGLTLGGLSAAATLNGTATAFTLSTIGIGSNSLTFLNALLAQSTSGFNIDTLRLLGSAMTELMEFMADPANANELNPDYVGVGLSSATQLESTAASTCFALRNLANGQSLTMALQTKPNSLPSGVDRSDPVVSAVYASILGKSDSSASPTPIQKQTAAAFNSSGP